MKRAILGTVAGWVTMALVVMAGFVAGPLALGLDRVLEPGTYRATALWIGLAMGIGLIGGAAGGFVAARVSRGRGAVLALIALVLVGTLASELTREPAPDPPIARPADQPALEALQAAQEHGEEPPITRVTNPLVGVAGLLLGAALARRGKRRG